MDAMKNIFFFLIAALTLLHTVPAGAENYELYLTRKGSNVYNADGKDIIIQTRYCYEYAYSQKSIFISTGYGGEVIFLNSNEKCDVKAVFSFAKQNQGKYKVTVRREEDDWYELLGTNIYIKTLNCLSMSYGEEAFLIITPSSSYNLKFKDGSDCIVENVYKKIVF